jgi:urea transporter
MTSLHILTSLVAPSFNFIVQLQAMPNTLHPFLVFLLLFLFVKQEMKPKNTRRRKPKKKEIEKT